MRSGSIRHAATRLIDHGWEGCYPNGIVARAAATKTRLVSLQEIGWCSNEGSAGVAGKYSDRIMAPGCGRTYDATSRSESGGSAAVPSGLI
jgi:hypothetical protein